MINPDPLKAADELEKWAAGLEQRAVRYNQLQQQLDATSATATSPDGSVRVTVDSNGVPTDVALSERTRGADPAHVSAQIMAGMRKAQADLRHRVRALIQETVPADDEPARNLAAQYEQRFPDLRDDGGTGYEPAQDLAIGRLDEDDRGTAAPPPPPQRPARRDDTDGDWDDRTFLR
ncbi:YbaB/EbfC family nucleoid-associated protein [Saccharothrix sp.]|uniref:YbaB/EbfC family nucleoid-associated protein n=1 Tax=Saccharothrix sp. TaxID=1873460 RepID=UPI002810F7E9|nr:YbaB/EbfC family nucleoid-associated protein [Saccharothrix sp.]